MFEKSKKIFLFLFLLNGIFAKEPTPKIQRRSGRYIDPVPELRRQVDTVPNVVYAPGYNDLLGRYDQLGPNVCGCSSNPRFYNVNSDYLRSPYLDTTGFNPQRFLYGPFGLSAPFSVDNRDVRDYQIGYRGYGAGHHLADVPRYDYNFRGYNNGYYNRLASPIDYRFRGFGDEFRNQFAGLRGHEIQFFDRSRNRLKNYSKSNQPAYVRSNVVYGGKTPISYGYEYSLPGGGHTYFQKSEEPWQEQVGYKK